MAAAFDADDRWFRPHCVVDADGRVCAWPEATAQALAIPAEVALGRPCCELLGHTQCGPQCPDAPEGCARCCARLPAPTAAGRWLVWADLDHLHCGGPGSTLLEASLVRGALALASGQRDLESALDCIRRTCGADDCEVFLLEPEGRDVALRACVGADRDAFYQQTRMPLGYGYPGTVTATGEPMCSNRFQDDARFRREAVKQRGLQTFIGVPVLDQARALGYLGVGWKRDTLPLAWGVHLLQAMQPIVVGAVRRLGRGESARVPCALRVLGAVQLGVGAQAQRPGAGLKALDLLGHLILARDGELPSEQLIGKLWPGNGAAAGAQALHAAIEALAEWLARAFPGRGGNALQKRQERVRLDAAALGLVDVHCFVNVAEAALSLTERGESGAALARLEQAVSLYRGEFFEGSDDAAFAAPRRRYRALYQEAMRLLVDRYLRDGRIDAAQAVLGDARERLRAAADGSERLPLGGKVWTRTLRAVD